MIKPTTKHKSSLKARIKEIGVLDAGWSVFTILFKKSVKSENEECLGYVDWDTCEIHIEDSIKDILLKETLLHEVVHVLLSTIGVKAEDEDCHTPLSFTNEYITEQTARGLLLLHRLNPELWELIFDDQSN